LNCKSDAVRINQRTRIVEDGVTFSRAQHKSSTQTQRARTRRKLQHQRGIAVALANARVRHENRQNSYDSQRSFLIGIACHQFASRSEAF
jgi:hypothetical protein